MTFGFDNQGLIPEMNFVNIASVVVALTAGSAFLMWVGDRITEKGVGNGISIVLMINILSRVPNDIVGLFSDFVKGKTVAKGCLLYTSVSNAWAGLGAAFGPTIVLSLFWKRTNLAGAVAGIVSGGATVILWDYIPLAGGQTLGAATGLYSLVVGFAISLLLIVVFSLMTKAPDEEMLREFDDVAKKRNIE